MILFIVFIFSLKILAKLLSGIELPTSSILVNQNGSSLGTPHNSPQCISFNHKSDHRRRRPSLNVSFSNSIGKFIKSRRYSSEDNSQEYNKYKHQRLMPNDLRKPFTYKSDASLEYDEKPTISGIIAQFYHTMLERTWTNIIMVLSAVYAPSFRFY